MRKRKKFIFLLIILFILFGFFTVDYIRVNKNDPPIFVVDWPFDDDDNLKIGFLYVVYDPSPYTCEEMGYSDATCTDETEYKMQIWFGEIDIDTGTYPQ